jgi:hypothetical protein
MNRAGAVFLEQVRIILAITLKDIVDVVRNRTLLSVLAAVLLMVAFFRDGDSATLAVVDPGRSAVVERWAQTGRPVHIDVANDAVFTHPCGLRPVTTSFLMVYALVVVGLMIAPNLMIEEKELKTMEALLISPAGAGQIVTAKALTGLVYCLVAGGLVLAASTTMVVHWDVALLAATCGPLFTVSLGILLGVILNARQQMIVWSAVLMFSLFVPVIASEVLTDLQAPALVGQVISLVPTVAVAEAIRWALSGQVSWAEIGWGLTVTLAWAIPLLAVVAWIVRRSER